MKLSLKFREESKHENPLLRAKIPITILGLPFLSGIVAGDSSDLSFSLRSDFSAGPSLSLSYHPTRSPSPSPSPTLNYSGFPPFSVAIKSGIGVFGSPKESPLVFSANFDVNYVGNPRFSLFIKPQFGNFSLFKEVNSGGYGGNRVDRYGLNGNLGNGLVSDFVNGVGLNDGSKAQGGSFSVLKEGDSGARGVRVDGYGLNGNLGNGSGLDFGNEGALGDGLKNGGVLKGLKRETSKGGILSGIFVAARTTMPIAKKALVNFRWGVDFPTESEGFKSGFPVLVMNKISLERIEESKHKVVEDEKAKAKAGDLELLKGMCGWMKREVEDLQKENREMRIALDGLKPKHGYGRSIRGEDREKGAKKALHSHPPSQSAEGLSGFERWRSNKNRGVNGSDGSGEECGSKEMKTSSSELENELQKAIKAASV